VSERVRNMSPKEAKEFNQKGNDFLKLQHDFPQALQCYSLALSLDPNNYIYYNNRAVVHTLTQQYTQAIHDCDASIHIQPNVRAYSRKAVVLSELGRLNEALEEVKRALQLVPNDQQSLNIFHGILELLSQAEILKQKGNKELQVLHDYKSAVVSYTSAIAIVNTNYIYYNNRAAAWILAGEYKKAIEDCEKSFQIQENVRSLSRKATALGELGNLQYAIEVIDQALMISPEDKQSLNVQSGLHVMRDQAEKFKEQGSIQLKIHQNPKAAIKYFSNAIAITNCNYLYFNHRAAAYLFAEDYSHVLIDCDISLKLKENTRAYAWKASALGDLGRIDEAIATVEKGLDLKPTDPLSLEIEAKLLKMKVIQDDMREQEEENSLREHEHEHSHEHGGGLLTGLIQLGKKVTKKVPLDYKHQCAHEDANLTHQQIHSRRFRLKLKALRDEKHFIHLYLHEDGTLLQNLARVRRERQERKREYTYQQRVKMEDEELLSHQFQHRSKRKERFMIRLENEDRYVVNSLQHSRDLRHWKKIIDQMAHKAKIAKAEADAKRDSANWIKENLIRKQKEAGLLDNHQPKIPEHLLPFDEKISLWRDQIQRKLRKEWVGMTFTVEYVENEGLCIGFDIDNEEEMEESNLDFKIARYMNRLAINGILHDKKLHKRADRWRVLEDATCGRGMSLNFYCHIPRTVEAHLKMPRTTDIDIIERESGRGLYDYDLVPRERVVQKIGVVAYTRENRPPMIKDKKKKEKLRLKKKKGVPDTVEFVELPSVCVETVSPGFVRMSKQDNTVCGRPNISFLPQANTNTKTKVKVKVKVSKGGVSGR
jgi:tetratricopeptide (TPR) repeat protein